MPYQCVHTRQIPCIHSMDVNMIIKSPRRQYVIMRVGLLSYCMGMNRIIGQHELLLNSRKINQRAC